MSAEVQVTSSKRSSGDPPRLVSIRDLRGEMRAAQESPAVELVKVKFALDAAVSAPLSSPSHSSVCSEVTQSIYTIPSDSYQDRPVLLGGDGGDLSQNIDYRLDRGQPLPTLCEQKIPLRR